ncbi:bacillithiol system redox-active protein YtxJ [Flavobacterium solisilvae]|uniref:Bacillithiol system redox-active protein YtxJ n=1 Tax=Flavobacterium solisilvae TaxID=1852019 RepID=A0ABX1QVE8_9FLAO|nr:bacillithiol system redox-active protein YtxJ [Flavobacterium solisilvae]NMH26267.1 bacillithiol system redox-active protein YtxJ [Flavobacterium solisilvae]
MSFLDKLFGNNKPQSMPDVFWNELESLEQLKDVEAESFEKPIVIFKHSTRCSISRMAWNQFQKEFTIPDDKMSLYYLDLLVYREISNAIAERFGIIHQSPQIIVIKDGKAIFDTSHESIDAKKLEQYLN